MNETQALKILVIGKKYEKCLMSVIEYKRVWHKSNMKNMNHSYIREIFIEKYP